VSGFIVAVHTDHFSESEWNEKWKKALSHLGAQAPEGVQESTCGPAKAAITAGSRGYLLNLADSITVVNGEALSMIKGAEEAALLLSQDRDAFLSRASGFFSAAMFDSHSNKLILVRDRHGTRTIWYVQLPGLLIAASNCKMLKFFVSETSVESGVIRESMIFRQISGSKHLLKPFCQVLPASTVTLDVSGASESQQYWAVNYSPEPATESFEKYVDGSEHALRQSYHELGLTDRPFAILLSGGIDSSVIAATALKECTNVIAIIGRVAGNKQSETDRALFVADSLGMDYIVVDIDESMFQQDLEAMVKLIEQPPLNPNNLVLQQLLRAIPKEVDFVVTGDAPEISFGGGNTHKIEHQYMPKRLLVERFIPAILGRILSRGFKRTDNLFLWRLARLLEQDQTHYASTYYAIEYTLPVKRILNNWASGVDHGGYPTNNLHVDPPYLADNLIQYLANTFLQTAYLRHDRLSESFNLSVLYPFLSPSVIDFGLKIPREHRYKNKLKPILHSLCDRYLPHEVSRWPKLGFPVPWRDWLDGPLRSNLELIQQDSLAQQFLPSGMGKLILEKNDYEGMWSLITLELVLREFLSDS